MRIARTSRRKSVLRKKISRATDMTVRRSRRMIGSRTRARRVNASRARRVADSSTSSAKARMRLWRARTPARDSPRTRCSRGTRGWSQRWRRCTRASRATRTPRARRAPSPATAATRGVWRKSPSPWRRRTWAERSSASPSRWTRFCPRARCRVWRRASPSPRASGARARGAARRTSAAFSRASARSSTPSRRARNWRRLSRRAASPRLCA
mmetsp:Transcript_5446/g.22041  ORF Transcript_5446/g.22041 Transcript_5446/m.22041 type:complete len:211 (-) Transcript_5446:1509-2141(-)